MVLRSLTVPDPYGFVFYTWGVRRQLPMGELKNYSIQEPDAQTASCRTCGGRRTDKGVNKQEPDNPAALPRCNRSLTGLRSLVSGSTRSALPRTT